MIAKLPTRGQPPGKTPGVQSPSEIRLRLYVAGSTPNSQRAKANLANALQLRSMSVGYHIEIIDVLVDARRLAADSVIVTPTLIAVGPIRRAVMVGDLSEAGKLESFLKSAADVG